jgi:hypothetical protein
MASAPPPPSIVSLPDPVVIVLADDRPVTVIALDIAPALRFSKLATLVVSPDVWSTPEETVKLTAVTVELADRISVSEPAPPSIEVSLPLAVTVSLPPPALMASAPPLPSIVSSPDPPVIVLAEEDPVIDKFAETADASTFWNPVTVTESPEVWSELARLTVVAALRISVLVPLPPSIDVSAP